MTLRERFKEALLFGTLDKVPLNPGYARESTIAAWHTQGMPPEVHDGGVALTAALELLRIDPQARVNQIRLEPNFKMIPEFEPVILKHQDHHYVIRDWMGAVTEISDQYDESYLRAGKDFVTRKWHKFPVETRDDWEEMKTRYHAGDPDRLIGEFGNNLQGSSGDAVISMQFNGVFWQLREWCGLENLCVMMMEDPEFVHEMADFWTDFVTGVLKKALSRIPYDTVMISEDMAYKAHSMISPALTREFLLPAYQVWVPLLHQSGCKIIELDSDGCIDELIPLWIEADIHCNSPVEVAAHCDILDYRRKYGREMAYIGGIDKRVIARGGKELERHVMDIVPEMFKLGGYIPGCDHGVPPDISWKNYLAFTEMLAKLSGWL